MEARRPFCADISAESGELLTATASRIDHWLLVEYRGLWAPQPLDGSALPQPVKEHLARQVAALPRCRLLFIRRPERRRQDGIACFYGSTPERDPRFFRLELDGHDDLLDVDFTACPAEPLEHPLLVVCTHGKRDRCCARYGRPLYDALREQVDPGWVWQSSHVGGDRFAGNVVCLPEGLYFGRVAPAEVWALVDEYVAGRIYLERYRGRCCYPFPVQAADRAVRAKTGLVGVGDLDLVACEPAAGGWDVQFAAGEEVHEVHVSAERGELTQLTCNAESLRRPRRYVTTLASG